MVSSQAEGMEAQEAASDWRDDWVLKLLFFVMLMGAVAAVTYDYQQLTNGALRIPGVPDFLRPVTPIALPRPDDQVRRYSPRAKPSYQPGETVRMPGFEGDPSERLADPMTFYLGEDGRASAIGRIEIGAFEAFERFVAVHATAGGGVSFDTLVLHSPGGSVQDALAMSSLIRDLELDTEVTQNGYCASSCPLVFAGGVERSAMSPVWIGVHQVFAIDNSTGTLQDGIASAQHISSQAQQHLVDMGVDPASWIHAMATPKDQLYLFTRDELADFGWITEDR